MSPTTNQGGKDYRMLLPRHVNPADCFFFLTYASLTVAYARPGSGVSVAEASTGFELVNHVIGDIYNDIVSTQCNVFPVCPYIKLHVYNW